MPIPETSGTVAKRAVCAPCCRSCANVGMNVLGTIGVLVILSEGSASTSRRCWPARAWSASPSASGAQTPGQRRDHPACSSCWRTPSSRRRGRRGRPCRAGREPVDPGRSRCGDLSGKRAHRAVQPGLGRDEHDQGVLVLRLRHRRGLSGRDTDEVARIITEIGAELQADPDYGPQILGGRSRSWASTPSPDSAGHHKGGGDQDPADPAMVRRPRVQPPPQEALRTKPKGHRDPNTRT